MKFSMKIKKDYSVQEVLNDFKDWHQMIKKYQAPNHTKATIQTINSFGFFIGLWVLQYFLLDFSIFWVLGLAVLNGFLLGRVFIVQHDCGHASFTKSKIANDIIGTVCSVCTIIPYKYWAKSHNYHHAHNGQIEVSDIGDVKVLTTEQYDQLTFWKKVGYKIYRSPLYLFTIGGFIYVVLYNRFAILRSDYFKNVRANVTWSNLMLLAVYTGLALLLGVKEFLLVQFINIFFFGTYALWFFYIQHQYEHIYKSTKENWNYVLSAVKGSTFYDLPSIGHWLTGNIGFHHIHHLSPSIPNYNLKACYYENPVFVKHANSITLWESFKTVYANLWDEGKQKMVSFAEHRRNRRAARRQ